MGIGSAEMFTSSRIANVGLALVLLVGPAQAQVELRPFPIDWSRPVDPALDLSRHLKAPAGGDGYVRMRGQHLTRPDGSRFRIWGVNLCGPDCFPTREQARRLADDLARLGINAVRFHHMDSTWSRLFDRQSDDTRHLDPEALDRFDYLVFALKERGIYSNINLNVGRQYKPGDGVRDADRLGYGKGATFFNPRLIELQRELATQILTHRNPYTGNEYRHEPAVITVELINENSLLEAWVGRRLVGSDDPEGGNDTWRPLPKSYDEELTNFYQDWLKKEGTPETVAALRVEAGVAPGAAVPRLRPDQFAKASRARFHTEARFYMHLERSFFEGMRRLLKDELGLGSLLVGTADHNDGVSGYPHIASNLALDFIDGHGYWEHPRLDGTTWTKNSPMVNDPLDSTVAQFARTPVVDRPFTISETNHPFPHVYACEGFLILTAYALLHDWDGIYWFTWGRGREADPAQGVPRNGWFDFSVDPVKLANLRACGWLWHRQDVRPAPTSIVRSYDAEGLIESLRMDRASARPFFTPGFARSTPLQYKTRFALDGRPATAFPEAAPLGRVVSETGELNWEGADQRRGVVVIQTPRAEALIGFTRDAGRATAHLAARLDNEFCALMLTSLEDESIERAQRLSLMATAQATNTGLRWKEDKQTVAEWGQGPVLVEPVKGEITLRGLAEARGVTVAPLGSGGALSGPELSATKTAEGWVFPIGATTALEYRITVARP